MTKLKKVNPFRIIAHPIDAFEEMKEKRNGSVMAATIILAVYTLVEILNTIGRGFLFNTNKIEDFNILIILSRSLFMVLLFVLANWSLCTLLEGEGRIIDIYIYTCYCLLPLIAFKIFYTIISNVIILDEKVFIDMINVAINIWFASLLIFALKTLHNYTFKKIIVNMIFSVIGMAIIFFIIFLLVILLQQLYIFVLTIWTELRIRMTSV